MSSTNFTSYRTSAWTGKDMLFLSYIERPRILLVPTVEETMAIEVRCFFGYRKINAKVVGSIDGKQSII